MNHRNRRLATLALASAVLLVMGGFAGAAQAKGKTIQTEAQWVSFDADSNTITVKVRKPGKKVKDKEIAIRKGKEATFDVIPTGSVLTRTTVKVNGRKGELTDIPPGKIVNVYWLVDEAKSTKRFARSIDLILSEAEIEARSEVVE